MGHRPLIAVYMEASRPFGVIYIGMTGNLFRRGQEHLDGRASGFARKHSCNMLVWYEEFALVTDAIQREKSLKRWLRPWKMQLIEQTNPDWLDLFPSLCGTAPDPRVKPEDDDLKNWLAELDRKSASEADDPS